jgi:tartrate dehydrogenase/decarboxylase / D-malate dehydrogenase
VGQGIANPIADLWSLQLMLDFLGEAAADDLLMRAVEEELAAGATLTPDLGGHATHRLSQPTRLNRKPANTDVLGWTQVYWTRRRVSG